MPLALTAGAAGLLAALAPAALGQTSSNPADFNTVMSIEGPATNMAAPAWVALPRTGTKVVRDSGGQKVRISSRSVLAQVLKSTSAQKIALKWAWYPSFGAPWITSIGGLGAKGAEGWNFRVNSLYLARAANKVNLGSGDRVTWYWGKEFATVLEIATPGVGSIPGVVVGPGPFTVTINKVTSKNVRTPAAGVTVSYGASTATTGADGTARFTATSGISTLRASAPTLIAATKRVCVEGTDPACGG